jgi:glycosyltransferase involved in cell wall biosynthesis
MTLAIVVPAHNAARTLPQCLSAIRRSGEGDFELLVVDDGSTDETAAVARSLGATVLRQKTSVGPASARNIGARSTTADLLLFVDADVVIAADAISRVNAAFQADPTLSALFGSYDASPTAGTLVSDYRNLLHNFTHQRSRHDSGSFWAGCGAVRTSVFLGLGGFDESYRRPSIEDIEFGARCSSAGHRIRLDRHLLCTHLKRWTLSEVVQVDIRDRAYPWSRLILERGFIPTDLNLQWNHRVSAVLVWTALVLALAAIGSPDEWRWVLLATAALSLGALAWLNREFCLWLARQRGLWFALGAFWLHGLYYAYSGATFVYTWLHHRLFGRFASERRRSRSVGVTPPAP